jgi:energy-coupling factor transport system substrate-specific component
MRDVFEMWGNTRMVVLTAISASLYAAILIPFKVLPIIPGVTELRPANAVPVVCSFLFGPAAAWGAGIGNVIGDFFGGIGPGSLFGFFGNFLYGLIPYKAWSVLTDGDPLPRSIVGWVGFLGVILLASGGCALTIGWGINAMGFIPFSILGNIILVNNFAVAAVLTPILLFVLYPRVKRGRLLYKNILPAAPARPVLLRYAGLLLVTAGVASGMVLGNMLSSGALDIAFLTALDAGSASGALKIAVGLLPSVAMVVAGVWLM